MEIHKPKPWHNLREFAKEYVIIVLGVATALGAEQTLEYFHWRDQVAEAREVIATELTTNMVGAVLRVRGQACTERRLDELAVVLDAAAKTGSLPPLGDIGSPWRQTWPQGVWESVVASQAASHFPRQELANMASTYKLVQRLEEYSARDVEAWNALYSMVGPGRRLAPATLDRLREALSQVRTTGNILYSQSIQLIEGATKLPPALDRENQDRLASAQSRPLSDIFVCRPIGAPAAAYGQGYINPVMRTPGRMDAAMKSLRDFSQGKR